MREQRTSFQDAVLEQVLNRRQRRRLPLDSSNSETVSKQSLPFLQQEIFSFRLRGVHHHRSIFSDRESRDQSQLPC